MFYMFGSPYQRGFFCSDESIRYPFKESTVTSSILYTVGLGLPTLVVSNKLIAIIINRKSHQMFCTCL